jgi:3-(3-hydroxy-phenyl)propionate hydroxylase
VFLAGDAAHQQPPFTGQGMCQGIRDVANLSWKLHYVLALNAADKLLDTYEQERKQHVKRLTTVIKDIGQIIGERDPRRRASATGA